MDLMDGDQFRAGQYGRDRALTVLEDRGSVILAAIANVEAGDVAGGNYAAPAEEAVRDGAEVGRAVDLDGWA
jgi:hypothetical protein